MRRFLVGIRSLGWISHTSGCQINRILDYTVRGISPRGNEPVTWQLSHCPWPASVCAPHLHCGRTDAELSGVIHPELVPNRIREPLVRVRGRRGRIHLGRTMSPGPGLLLESVQDGRLLPQPPPHRQRHKPDQDQHADPDTDAHGNHIDSASIPSCRGHRGVSRRQRCSRARAIRGPRCGGGSL